MMPLLKEDEIFYIEEDDKRVRIRQVIRTSKDNVLYICSPNINEDRVAYNKLKEELIKERDEWRIKNPKEEPKTEVEVTGFRKFIKNLFKL